MHRDVFTAEVSDEIFDSEPFSSWLCLMDLQYVDGLGELAGAPGAAAELAEDAPGLEPGRSPARRATVAWRAPYDVVRD